MLTIGATAPTQQRNDDDSAALTAVFHAFPEADSYRQIQRDVDRQTRTEVEQSLPFRLHFDELGKHTLLVAFRSRRPIGLVYLRSEESEYGLTEVAWAMSLDLRVLGFELPRCRNRHRRDLENSAFAKELAGRDSSQLVAMFKSEPPVTSDTTRVPAGAEQLADLVLRSALKALRVAELVWHDDVEKLQDQAMGYDAFPAGERFRRQVVQFHGGPDEPAHLGTVHVVRAIGRASTSLGSVVRTTLAEQDADAAPRTLRWVLDDQLRVLSVTPMESWAGASLRMACRELTGQLLADANLPDNDLRPVARELAAVMARLAERSAQR